MISKNQQVRNLVTIGEYKKALQICKDWNYADESHRYILRLGYACLMYPEFYKQINYDPEKQYQEAIKVLKQLYG